MRVFHIIDNEGFVKFSLQILEKTGPCFVMGKICATSEEFPSRAGLAGGQISVLVLKSFRVGSAVSFALSVRGGGRDVFFRCVKYISDPEVLEKAAIILRLYLYGLGLSRR
jgi:hypothetical protein